MTLRLLLSLPLAVFAFSAEAESTYPFELPAEISVTLHVNTQKKSLIRPMQLGLNCSWPEKLYGKVGFNHPDAQKLIRFSNPVPCAFRMVFGPTFTIGRATGGA